MSTIAKSAVGPQAKESRPTPIGGAARRASREPIIQESFGPDGAGAALDLLELLELAWHDWYGEVTPPDDGIDDVLAVAQGDVSSLARAARLAVEDSRDLRLAADEGGHGLTGMSCHRGAKTQYLAVQSKADYWSVPMTEDVPET